MRCSIRTTSGTCSSLSGKKQKERMGKRRQKLNTKGFTLVELIVTLVLMGILLSIGVFGLSAYTRFSKFKRQNETAQSLFVAAQTSLTQLVADGTAGDLAAGCSAAGSGAVLLNKGGQMQISLISAAGSAVTAADIWQKQNTDPYGTLYALTATPVEYQKYARGETLSAGAQALYEILDAYVYDKSILKDGTVCLEIDPEEGVVYSALYSQEAAEGFTYSNEYGKVDITDRTEKARREKMLGYYGVDSLSKSLSGLDGNPVIENLKLTNGDTLDLNWTLDNGSQALLAQLAYSVEIYDAQTNHCVLQLAIHQETHSTGNDTFVAQNSASAAQTIEVAVKRAKTNAASPVYANLGTYTFPAYVDDTNTVHLILDAADLGATEDSYQRLCQNASSLQGDNAPNELKNTFSMRRFLLEQLGTKNIYCKVSALSSTGTQIALLKESNAENMYFGSRSSDAADDIVYTLLNARHLNNVRYEENEKSFTQLTKDFTLRYEVGADIRWNGKDGAVQRGCVYDTNTAEWATGNNHGGYTAYRSTLAGLQPSGSYGNTDFTGISALREYASMTSAAGGKVYTIAGLSLSSENDIARHVPGVLPAGNTGAAEATGLFLTNSGKITGLALDDVLVTGQKNVGAFCGINCGILKNLEGKGGAVYGLSNVGGIFGTESISNSKLEHKVNNSLVMDSLINRADVVGHNAVGGITGQVNAGIIRLHGKGDGYGNTAAVSYVFQNCKNYGTVRGDWKALASDKNSSISSLYADIYKNGTPEDNDAIYIGGIVGYANARADDTQNGKHNASLTSECRFVNCISAPSMPQEKRDALLQSIAADVAKGGTAKDILRGTYVGGILGYGIDVKLENCTAMADSTAPAFVWGNCFVGGIMGAGTGDVINDSPVESSVNVLGRQYVGGILGKTLAQDITAGTQKTVVGGWTMRGIAAATMGYAGGITGENNGAVARCSVQNIGAQSKDAMAACAQNADYVGGLIGTNRGTVENCNVVSAEVFGRCFVGGMVGCEVSAASLTGSSVQSASVLGRDFVGGCAGLNLSAELADTASSLTITPTTVAGRYFVGGSFGACLIAAGNSLPSQIDVGVNAPKTKVSAENAYAGGYSGLMTAVSGEDVLALPAPGAQDVSLLGTLCSLPGSDLLTDCTAVEAAFANRTTPVLLTLAGKSGKNSITLAGVSAGVYGGGVVGYISTGSNFILQDLTNAAPVITNKTIAAKEIGSADNAGYSYAGGILGRVSRTVTLAACANAPGTAITVPQGCCTAALTEVNAGRIVECAAGTFGTKELSGVGGLVGTNIASGSGAAVSYQGRSYTALGMIRCSAAGAVGTGKDRIGGLAVFNYGLIQDPILNNCILTASGSDAGAAAAIQGGNGSILFTASTTLSGISVKADNRAGILAGQVLDSSTISCSNGMLLTLAGSCSARANANAGGAVGALNTGAKISDIENHASILAENSGAGGIAGSSIGTIERCKNYGTISAKGSAGGIAGSNSGTIRGSAGFGSVSGSVCGGIAGSNTGLITGCTFNGTVSGTVGSAPSTQYDAAQPLGADGNAIYGCGGIAGVNGTGGAGTAAKIEKCRVENASIYATGSAEAPANAGGIAGVNAASGTISEVEFGSDDTQTVTVADKGYYANGSTAPAAENIEYQGSVLVNAMQYGNAGGTAGLNAGTIDGVSVQASDMLPFAQRKSPAAKVLTVSDCGNAGGIAGYNFVGGTISRANTGSASIVWAAQEAAGTGCGGIAGCNVSAGSITDSNNWAVVIKMAGSAAGGLTGRSAALAGQPVYKNCANYGCVSAKIQAGGLIGTAENAALLLDACANFGRVTAAADAGGIVGVHNAAAGTTLTLQNCENHGTVGGEASSGGVGGILGSEIGGTASAVLRACANTGLIRGSAAESGGILGRCTAYGGSVTLQNCANFGYAAQGSSATNCGITPVDISKDNPVVSLSGCVGIADMITPVCPAGRDSCNACWYFASGATGSGELLTPSSTDRGISYSRTAPDINTVIFADLAQDPAQLNAATPGCTSDEGLAALGDADNVRYQMFAAVWPAMLSQLPA
jgi:prepilin-type N-terminal cleavage/methylation domain-containing protein